MIRLRICVQDKNIHSPVGRGSCRAVFGSAEAARQEPRPTINYSILSFLDRFEHYQKHMELSSVEVIIAALNASKVEYLIVGGLAVNAHGFVRMTRDVDIVLRLDPKNALCGLKTLLGLGYQMAIPARPEDFADSPTREQWRTEKNMIVLKLWSDQHRRTPIDIFIYEPFDFSEEMRHSVSLEIQPGIMAPVISLKALLAMKRVAGRPQDLIDIEELKRIQ